MSAESSCSEASNSVETDTSSLEYNSFPRPLKPLTLNKPVFRAKKINWGKALEKIEAIHPVIYEHLRELCLPQDEFSTNSFDSDRIEEEMAAMQLYLPQACSEEPTLETSRPPKRSRAHNSESSDDLDSEEENTVKGKVAIELCPPVSFRHFRKKMRMITKTKEDAKCSSDLLSSSRHHSEIVFPYLDMINASSSKGKAKVPSSRKSSRPATPKFFKSMPNI